MIKAELIDYMGSDLTVVNAARVSFAEESNWNDEGELNERCLLYTSPSPRDS